jgi:hypothetical protein
MGVTHLFAKRCTGKRKAGKIMAPKEGKREEKQWSMKPGSGRAKRF